MLHRALDDLTQQLCPALTVLHRQSHLTRQLHQLVVVHFFQQRLAALAHRQRRIRNRVARGGHDISADLVQARFAHRFADVAKILPYCDEADFFDNDNGFVPAAQYRGGRFTPIGSTPAWLRELLQGVP